jgi:siderophore synthetase component
MAFRYGLLFEPHPQNVLVELDENFNLTRFIYRDLQTVIVDAELRKELGFIDSFLPETKIIASWQEGLNKQLEYSSFYDHRMAYQTLEEIIVAIAAKYPAHIAELERIVKKVFWEVIKELGVDADRFFPKDTYYLYRDGMMKNNVMEPVPFNDPPYR